MSMKEILHKEDSTAISHQVSPALLLVVCASNFTRSVVDESGMILTQMGSTVDQKWSKCKGRLVCLPCNSKQ
jgi:hypothetical protein